MYETSSIGVSHALKMHQTWKGAKFQKFGLIDLPDVQMRLYKQLKTSLYLLEPFPNREQHLQQSDVLTQPYEFATDGFDLF